MLIPELAVDIGGGGGDGGDTRQTLLLEKAKKSRIKGGKDL